MRLRKHHVWAIGAAVATAALIAPAMVSHTTRQYVNTGICHVRGQLPDPTCTPGAVDPNVTQDNIQQTICVKGYTTTVRPPVSVTNQEKAVSQRQYGYPSGTVGEYDHLVALEDGGSNDTSNLWFEAGPIPNAKDSVENAIHRDICSGKITLVYGQSILENDWTQYIGK